MARKYPRLATADEIRTFLDRARSIFDVVVETDYEELESPTARRLEQAAYRSAKDALRFCAQAAGVQGDITLMPEVLDAISEQEHWEDYGGTYGSAAGDALAMLLRAGAPIDDETAALADHPEGVVRQALAEGLLPQGERAIALLEKLSRDPLADVRKPAQEALSKVREVAFWSGKFQRDPFADLTPDEVARHRPTVEKIAKLCDTPGYDPIHKELDLPTLVASLPDALAVDFCETQLSTAERYDARITSLGGVMITREGGELALLRLCEAWARQRYHWVGEVHVKMMESAPVERRFEVCMALARWALSCSAEEREERNGAAHIAACIAGQGFPPGGDLTPILDGLLALPEGERSNPVKSGLVDAFKGVGADPGPILERVIEARLSNYPDAWAYLGSALDELLNRAPRERLRRAAEEAIVREDDATVTWGLSQLLLHLHDPARDPEPMEVARRFMGEARYRRLIVKDHRLRKVSVSLLRAELREGGLDFAEAAAAVSMVGELWGGVIRDPLFRFQNSPREIEEKRQKERESFAAFLGPEELHGPVTDGEWAALRRARAAADVKSEDFAWVSAFSVLPPGPFEGEDREFLELGFKCLEEGGLRHSMFIGIALAAKIDEGDLPLFDRLLKLVPGAKGFTRMCLRAARESLGLPPEEESEAEAKEPSEEERRMREWMDD